jgi:hypothetical protein
VADYFSVTSWLSIVMVDLSRFIVTWYIFIFIKYFVILSIWHYTPVGRTIPFGL